MFQVFFFTEDYFSLSLPLFEVSSCFRHVKQSRPNLVSFSPVLVQTADYSNYSVFQVSFFTEENYFFLYFSSFEVLSCFRHVKQSCPNPVEFSPVLRQNAYLIASRFKTHSLQTTTIFFYLGLRVVHHVQNSHPNLVQVSVLTHNSYCSNCTTLQTLFCGRKKNRSLFFFSLLFYCTSMFSSRVKVSF